MEAVKTGESRAFDTEATRDSDKGKPDYDGFLSELVLPAFAKYMNAHRVQSDGNLRDSDNWKKGIPMNQYMKSAFRHFIALWVDWKGGQTADVLEEQCCALLFNIQGFLHELLKSQRAGLVSVDEYVSRMQNEPVVDNTGKINPYPPYSAPVPVEEDPAF